MTRVKLVLKCYLKIYFEVISWTKLYNSTASYYFTLPKKKYSLFINKLIHESHSTNQLLNRHWCPERRRGKGDSGHLSLFFSFVFTSTKKGV
jgi:hypothetical protein